MGRIAVFCTLLAVTASLSLPSASIGAETSDVSSPKGQASAFLARLSPGTWKGAAAELFAGSPLSRANPAKAAQLESRLQAMIHELGPSIGYELVTEKLLSESLVRLVYLLKFENQPTVFEFFYYRAHDSWEIVLLNVVPDIGHLRVE
jgi:hypothetical protein